MRIDILTLFPELSKPYLNQSIIKRAQEKRLLDIHVHDIRAAAPDAHHTVDDTPYGGGTGMVMKVDVVDRALQNVMANVHEKPHRILLSPQGTRLTAERVQQLAQKPWIILLAGHYEGFDERIREHLVDEQISSGDYVLTGGELPALVLIDAISRFVPGVLPEGAPEEDSHSLTVNGQPALEYPHYTRPPEYKGWTVPEVLQSGNHAEIERWRRDHLRPLDRS